ncbi:PA2779 family protein [Yoonia sp. 2307UL14-13]|uniref:PA2779 family protein n=1 Tax=Yoonia sp. 2307UL14-13 TaxID=3126506 RepID=UPI0030B2D53C
MGCLNLTKTGLAMLISAQLAITTTTATMTQAEMLGTEAAISKYVQHSDRTFLMDELQREEIRAEIVRLGVDPAEAEARLAALTDAEVASIMVQMEKDNAGADIVGTLFTIFIILLVTDILCLTRIFNFTRCVR